MNTRTKQILLALAAVVLLVVVIGPQLTLTYAQAVLGGWRQPQRPTEEIGPLNFWVAAPGLTTCSYNGGVAVTCTPSTNVTNTPAGCGTSPSTPCSDFTNMEQRIRNMIIMSLVTINVSDTAGGIAAPSGQCYQPVELAWHNPDINGAASDNFMTAGTAGAGGTYDYPRNYIYLLGNTTTPTNVNITGSATCGGTTSSAVTGIKFTGDMRVRIRGVSLNYFGGAAGFGYLGAIGCWNGSWCVMEDTTSTMDSKQYLLACLHMSTCIFGGTITVTNAGVGVVSEFSTMAFVSPLGRANITASMSTAFTGGSFFLSNENSYIQVDAMSLSVSGAAVNSVWRAINFGNIAWNDLSTFTAPAQSYTYNGANLTILSATHFGYIADFCRTIGQLTCTFTSMLKHANADGVSMIQYSGSAAGTSADTASQDSIIQNANGSQHVWLGTTFANLGTVVNGALKYCSNCTIANPCATGGTGAFAKGLNSVWVCN